MWLRIDERTDVLASLLLCSDCIRASGKDPAYWKWAILALHNALQGAMVCHLSGTAQIGALSDKSADAWLDWYERDGRGEIERFLVGYDSLGTPTYRFVRPGDHPPKQRLADAKELFRRLYREDKRREGGAGMLLVIESSQRASFQALHDLRNDFSHFTPSGWSIELSGLSAIFLDLIDVLETICKDPWPFRHISKEDMRKLIDTLRDLRVELCCRRDDI